MKMKIQNVIAAEVDRINQKNYKGYSEGKEQKNRKIEIQLNQ
jgi:hypothetical protein